MAAKTKTEPKGRGREIAGIALLGLSIFSFLSLASMHVGAHQMMGPGGAATASGLYALAGIGSYLLVAAMLTVAVRCFRGQSLHGGVIEVLGLVGAFSAFTVLAHLPFAHRAVTLRGPGGLLGQWLGEILASFVGTVGAALAALTLLAICLLVVTSISFAKAVSAAVWVTGKLGALTLTGVQAGARALGRVVVAMFPEKDEAEQAADSAAADADDAERFDDESDPVTGDERTLLAAKTIVGMPAKLLPLAESEPVRVGEAMPVLRDDDDEDDHALSVDADAAHAAESEALGVDEDEHVRSPRDEERDAVSALVAEVAAADAPVQRPLAPTPVIESQIIDEAAAAPPDVAERPLVFGPITTPVDEAGAATPSQGPIIVEPVSHKRQREAAEADAVDAQAVKDRAAGPGFVKLTEGAFKLPSTELLEYKAPEGPGMDEKALFDMAARLEQAMANYGVKGKVREIHMGPVVTMYEFAPAPGTRVGKLMGLEADLALSLEAQAVRVTSIPGKSVVGVEVPNKKREMVYMKEILEDDCFAKAGSKLQVCLGKDIKGAPVSVNLSKMPHLLVAGTTGSGKSVAVNGMITSMLYNATPEEVRFIMVDPKMLELSIYEGIPHLLLPVVTDPNKANLALRWAVEEMERRYELLAKTGVRDIASYNARIEATLADDAVAKPAEEKKKLKVMVATEDGTEREVEVEPDSKVAAIAADIVGGPVPEAELVEAQSGDAAVEQFLAAKKAEEEKPRKLPYIVIVIDEFADLMMVAPKDVETSVARIAQKARAAGLHLILATQRPSVDVITGLIKANFPSRIALQVASKIDARTILDQPGAETLLGNGDMLFSDRGTKLRRIHGAFLSDDEVHRVVDFLKTQAKPVYDMDILKPRDEDGEGDAGPVEEFTDALYDQAIAIVCDSRQASVSYIQRRLQIGYNRAARMVEQMERDGIVGPANGMKPREILAQAGEYLTQGV